jgi:hypothetical protein
LNRNIPIATSAINFFTASDIAREQKNFADKSPKLHADGRQLVKLSVAMVIGNEVEVVAVSVPYTPALDTVTDAGPLVPLRVTGLTASFYAMEGRLVELYAAATVELVKPSSSQPSKS